MATLQQKIVKIMCCFWGHFDNLLFDQNRTEKCSQERKCGVTIDAYVSDSNVDKKR